MEQGKKGEDERIEKRTPMDPVTVSQTFYTDLT